MRTREILEACRVPTTLETRRVGLWEIRRADPVGPDPTLRAAFRSLGISPDGLTMLLRDTLATMHRTIGECVMEDSMRELRRHLPVLVEACGRVLVSGLGLGCVVRGLLSKPEVEHVDVVEIDPSIVDLCGREFMNNSRVTLHLGDAETIEWPEGTRWDFAWHDVWSEHEALDIVHARLFLRYAAYVGRQGAWQFDRRVKRTWPDPLLGQRRAVRRRLERAA